VLELSGAIACVLPNLEHRRDEDFYFHERLRLLGSHRLRNHEGAGERAHKPAGEMLRQRKSAHALSFQRRDNSSLAANIPGGVGGHKGEASE
jgi:hypothetical protein